MMRLTSSSEFPQLRATRRKWLLETTRAAVVPPLLHRFPKIVPLGDRRLEPTLGTGTVTECIKAQGPAWETLVRQSVAAAMRAGAQYADARITHAVTLPVGFASIGEWIEMVGVGVRALVNGYWGFAAVPSGDTPAVEQLARDAVAQAKINAQGLPRTVDLETIPTAVGQWTMPVRIDPFAVPIEEKLATIQYWMEYAEELRTPIVPQTSKLYFIRQEQVVATSDGAHFSQTFYESGGNISVQGSGRKGTHATVVLDGLSPAGKGWEQMLDADIPGQLRAIPERVDAQVASMANPKAAQVGRYTLVCDGATMAALTERTLGMATQIDRALGYEANASGTSFLNEPLAMLGSLQLTSPLVTVTANRSAPGQLATVKWDTEGVEPDDFTLIHDGVLVDYQTTREQAAWLAPYYQKARRPVRSHGCAAVQNALSVPMQHMPNLALAAARTDVTTDDLVANIKEGVLVTHGETKADFQARTGTLTGIMHEIKNGRVGRPLQGGAVIYDTIDFWKHVIAVGGTSTQAVIASTTYPGTPLYDRWSGRYPAKGEPPQRTSTSIQGVAATVTNQAIVDLRRKA